MGFIKFLKPLLKTFFFFNVMGTVSHMTEAEYFAYVSSNLGSVEIKLPPIA